jgi:hypothetical protein
MEQHWAHWFQMEWPDPPDRLDEPLELRGWEADIAIIVLDTLIDHGYDVRSVYEIVRNDLDTTHDETIQGLRHALEFQRHRWVVMKEASIRVWSPSTRMLPGEELCEVPLYVHLPPGDPLELLLIMM